MTTSPIKLKNIRKSYGVTRATNSFFPIQPLVNFHAVQSDDPNEAVTEFPDPMTIIAQSTKHDLDMVKKIETEHKHRGKLVLVRLIKAIGDWELADEYEIDRKTVHPGYGSYVVIKVDKWLAHPSIAWRV